MQLPNPFIELKDGYEPIMTSERLLLGSLAAIAVTGTALPLFFSYLPKEVKLLSNSWGLVSSLVFSATCAIRERKEKTYASIEEANYAIVKESLKSDFTYQKVSQEIIAKREIAAFVNNLPVEERGRWSQEYGLQGLVELPQIQQAVIEQPRLPSSHISIPSPDIAKINEDAVQAIINPSTMSLLQSLSAEYPKYIRLDEEWIDELCDSSCLQNMSDRANHHFMIVGGTQSGKSTLAGVIVNKIAAKSQSPAVVIGSDPKDQVTKWLCQFSRKFDGMKTLPQWIKFATEVIDLRKQEIGKNKGTNGISELFFIQDEVDSCYGGGKGFPGRVSKETAGELQVLWHYLAKFTAGLKCHGIFLGQSPLSEATGFSRPNLKNICFMALGQMSAYILGRPTDFLNGKAEILEILKEVCELLDKEGVRYALIVPTRGNPYVALIPVFDIDGLEQKESQENIFSEDIEPLSNTQDWYNILLNWIEEIGRNPTDEELKIQWRKITNQELNANGVKLLKERLGFNQ